MRSLWNKLHHMSEGRIRDGVAYMKANESGERRDTELRKLRSSVNLDL